MHNASRQGPEKINWVQNWDRTIFFTFGLGPGTLRCVAKTTASTLQTNLRIYDRASWNEVSSVLFVIIAGKQGGAQRGIVT